MHRRRFVRSVGITAMGGWVAGVGCRGDVREDAGSESRVRREGSEAYGSTLSDGPQDDRSGMESWEGVRARFGLDPAYIHMAGLLLTSHPAPVGDAIEGFRRSLDRNPALFVDEHDGRLKGEVREAASRYMEVEPEQIALTDSTTMGTGLAITGLRIREDQEMLTAHFDYYSTHQAMRYQSQRSGASMREVPLYRDSRNTTEEEMVEGLVGEVRPNTRLVTATWVHSATGVKVPVRRIADELEEINEGRADADRVVFFVDGVHGFGVEDEAVGELGCDIFVSGTHKWLFGPRGTGILWGHPRVHHHLLPTIPNFTIDAGWGGRMSPGGFKPFEHEWAMAAAFDFHGEIGRTRVRNRIHALARQTKEGLAEMDHVTLHTPMSDALSSGIVCFDLDGMSPVEVVEGLAGHDVIASVTPYSPPHARLTPGVFNTPEEVDEALRAVRALA